MLRKLISWFKNLRMSNQIIIINFFIIFFAVFVAISTAYVQQTIFFTIISEFEQALSLKQEKTIVNNISREIRLYIHQKNYQLILNLRHSQQMFNQFTSFQSEYQINVDQFQDCVEEEEITENNIIYNSDIICQGAYTNQYDNQGILLQKMLSFLTPFTQLFMADEESRIIIVDIPKNQILAQFPKMYKYKNFITSTRPWYRNHIYQYQKNPKSEYFYSPIYLSVRNLMPYFALTYSLMINQTLFGMIAQIQEIQDKNIESIPLSIFLVNYNGDVILSTLQTINEQNLTVKITNETKTGFNETDWEFIKTISKNNITERFKDASFYLENKIFNKKVFVNAFRFEKENLTLIVFKNVTYEIETEEKIEEQVNSVKKEMIQQVQIYIGICLILVILTTSFIRWLSAPLLNLIQLINIHIRKIGNNLDSELFKMALKTKKQTDVFSSLTYSLLGLKDLQTKRSENKNQTCQQIEDIKYNFNYQEIDCTKIKEQILLLPGTGKEDIEIFQKTDSFFKPLLLRSFSQKKLWVSTCDETQYRLILIKQIFQQLFQKNSFL